ncbi:hypothetical protein [Lichenifustis flavocetrariae]|uniref:Uncharacterized protein n=1 Tax=Lichenifustis flavocetrariae TaxID=2949735 RepID=A0AA41Z0C2_9HYPH|nr:hypothetical protein [Lichenifustis flavocetrariae]MCW6506987.1 hypothetical protein [Lichenifustis flavocetrariae]
MILIDEPLSDELTSVARKALFRQRNDSESAQQLLTELLKQSDDLRSQLAGMIIRSVQRDTVLKGGIAV